MKITLKTIVLIVLLAFFIAIVLSNFSNLEGFVAADSTILSDSVISEASDFNKDDASTKSVPRSTSAAK